MTSQMRLELDQIEEEVQHLAFPFQSLRPQGHLVRLHLQERPGCHPRGRHCLRLRHLRPPAIPAHRLSRQYLANPKGRS